jgi:hypothetical protein
MSAWADEILLGSATASRATLPPHDGPDHAGKRQHNAAANGGALALAERWL